MRRVLTFLLLMVAAAPSIAAQDAPADSLIWVSEQAAADSLAGYWERLSRESWYEPLRPEDLGIGLNPARNDSLRAAGDLTLDAMLSGRPWRLRVSPGAGTTFNRAEGPVLGIEAELNRAGVRQPSWKVRGTWGFAREKGTLETSLRLPLGTARLRDARGRRTRSVWTSWLLDARAGRTVEHFGGERDFPPPIGPLLDGVDVFHFLERTRAGARLSCFPRRWLRLRVGAAAVRDRPLSTATRWSLLGEEEDVPENLPASALETHDLELGLELRRRGLRLDADLILSRLRDPVPGLAAEGEWVRRIRLDAAVTRRDPWHNAWTWSASWSATDRGAPLQWATWLGGWGTLRGFEPGELVGDHGGHTALEVRWNRDLLRDLRVPVLKNWGLQPTSFCEFGSVDAGPETDLSVGARGWRADVGVGLSRMIALGPDGPVRLSLNLARPVGQHRGKRGWRFSAGVSLP